MPAVIGAIYLLLALRVRVSLEGSLCGTGGNLVLSAGAAGMYIRFDGVVKKEGVFFTIAPRYAVRPKKAKKKEAHRKSVRVLRTYLWFARTGRMERLTVNARIGLGDACETAMIAGALRALASAAVLRVERGVDLHVVPDFDCASCAMQICCVFSCQPGDIMLAAIRFFMRKKWKSRIF